MLALLLGAAVYRVTLAGCPEGWREGGFACLFLPTHADLGVHLLSYAFMGVVLSGIFSWLVLWRRQWINMRRLTINLVRLRIPDSELEPLTGRLGLKDKVHLLDSKVPLCFCAGFISPRIYLSRGMMERLTPEQLEALLLHEKYHLENYDSLKILLGRLAVLALFFIPVLQDIFKRYLIEKEIAADQNAIQYQGHYRGLVGVLNKLVQARPTAPVEAFITSGTEALEYRIDYLTGHAGQRVHRMSISHLVTSFLIIVFVLITIVVPLPSSHSINSDIAGTLFSYLA